jgi:hypothetical protein
MCGLAHAQVSVTTFHNDNARTGQNTLETILTPANVNNQNFGRLFSVALDGYVYAQPLYLQAVNIAGASHNVVYMATEHDSVYAIDADSGTVYAQTSLIPSGGTTVSSANDLGGCPDLIPEIGITGTPVIDPTTNTLYVVSKGKTASGTMVQYLHALDVGTLAEKFGGPTLITASSAGTGLGGTGSTVPFNTVIEFQRPALLLENSHVIIGWAGHCDASTWHGWVMSYSASTLAQEAVFNVSPNGYGGAVWMSGGGIAADANGNLYFPTGNGTWNGTTDFSNSIVKLGPPSGGQFPVLDYFTPWNQAALASGDYDVSSGGLVLLPPLASGQQLLAQQGKFGSLVLLQANNLGKYCPNLTPACNGSDSNTVLELVGLGGVWGSPAYWNGNFYIVPANSPISAYSFNAANSGTLSLSPTSTSSQSFAYAAPTPAISANGSTNGILWALDGSAYNSTCGTTGVNCLGLFAYDATNLNNLLYSSAQSANDSPGVTVKYTVPVIANGKVYVGTQSGLSVYGPLSHVATLTAPGFSPAAGNFSSTQTVSLSDATAGATIYYTTNGQTPTTSSSKYSAPITVSATTTIQAIAVAGGYTNSPVASATYTISLSATAPVNVSLASADNLYGITSDGSYVLNGGLDGGSSSYSATLLGTSIVWGGSTFTLGAAGTPNAVTSKTITLPAGNYSSLNLLATAVNGPQVNQPFVVTYSDGTSTTFTQSVSDWGTPQNFSGESTVLTMAYRLLGGGSQIPSTTYLYGYSFALNSAKSVASLTLPTNRNVTVLAISLTPATAVTPTAASPTFSPIAGSYSAAQTVSLSDGTAGAAIYYTTNGTTPSASSTKYTAPITVGVNTTIQAIAAASGYSNSTPSSATYSISAARPTFALAAGTYTSTQTVSLSDTTPGAVIYYTTDGSTPTSGSAKYSAPLTVSATTTIQAIAVASGYANSAVAGATYTISALSPTFSPVSGTFSTPTVTVTLADSTPGAVIYYTTNGTTPTTSSAKYSAPLTLSASTTIQAIAVASGLSNSSAASATYTVAVLSPTFSPAPGSYSSTQTVSLSDATPGDAIYYTTDGSTPTTSSAVYGAPLTVSANMTIKAIGAAAGYTNSAVSSATYTIGVSGTAPVAVNLASADNVYGITSDGSYVLNGGLDGGYASYSATLLGTTIVWGGSTFTLGAAGTPNAVSSKTITLPAGNYTSLKLLGTAVNGAQTNQPFVVTYTDGSSTTFTQSLSDWGTPQGFAGESTVLTMAYRLVGGGSQIPSTTYLYGYSFALNSAKSVASIMLPTNRDVLVLAMDLTASTQAASPGFSPAAGNYSSTQTVSLSDTTPGAVIYYTTDGSAPTTGSTKYSAPLTVSATTTIQAIAVASGLSSSAPASATYTISAASPTFSPGTGNYSSTQTVSLSDTTPGAVIYYTINGGTPTTSSAKYSAPLTVSATTTIQAIAVASGYSNSAPASATYTMGAATPTFTPTPGSYTTQTVTVSIADSTPGASIYYTINGGTPTTSSAKYSAPLTIGAATTIQAIAVASGYNNSAVASATYSVSVATPTFSPAAGSYGSTQSVSLSDATPGATIYYTTNGATPTTSSSVYSAPLTVSATTTIQAIAVAAGYSNSTAASATYTIAAAAPTFSPAAGTYSTSTVTVSLADSTPGAVIYYTTNGATPSSSSSKYTSALTLGANTTIQAIAVAAGYSNSPVASAAYNVTATSPSFSLAAGNYTGTQTVSLSDAMPGATIYYTTNGSTPTTSSATYTAPLTISATTTIQAMAVAAGDLNSAVSSATYTISAPVPAPVSLGTQDNVYGIVNDGSAVPGTGLDLHEYAYSAKLLGTKVAWNGATFTLGAAGTLDAVENKTVALPAGNYIALNMLATAVNGGKVNMPFIVKYSDGTTTTFYQSLSDWVVPAQYPGESIASTMAYRLQWNGAQSPGPVYLYGYTFALNSAKSVVSLTLPSYINNVVVLGIDLTP